jgi:hypothetical protein
VKFSALNFLSFGHKIEGLILGRGILEKQPAEPMAPALTQGCRQLQGRLSSVLRIRIHMDPHHFGKLDPDPHRSEKQDPDPHEIKKVEAFDGHFGALEGPNLGKSKL